MIGIARKRSMLNSRRYFDYQIAPHGGDSECGFGMQNVRFKSHKRELC